MGKIKTLNQDKQQEQEYPRLENGQVDFMTIIAETFQGQIGVVQYVQEIREAFQLLIENNQDKMQLWLTETAMEEPARALEIILKMSEYIVPKLSRTEVKAEITDKSIVINLNRLNAKNN